MSLVSLPTEVDDVLFTGRREAITHSSDPDQVKVRSYAAVAVSRPANFLRSDLGSMQEVAACMLFLTSEEWSSLTGINLEISGGAR